MPTPKTLTVRAACDRSGLGETSIYTLMRSGVIESITAGRRRLIFTDSLDNYLDRLRDEQRTFAPQSVPWAAEPEPRRGPGRPRTRTT
jgi:excisionase family DNA binding protein